MYLNNVKYSIHDQVNLSVYLSDLNFTDACPVNNYIQRTNF